MAIAADERKREARIRELHRELTKLGERYRRERDKAKATRTSAELVVVELTELGEEQSKIAESFGVLREIIRRIQIKFGIDTGDPRTIPGSRIGNPEMHRKIAA